MRLGLEGWDGSTQALCGPMGSLGEHGLGDTSPSPECMTGLSGAGAEPALGPEHSVEKQQWARPRPQSTDWKFQEQPGLYLVLGVFWASLTGRQTAAA